MKIVVWETKHEIADTVASAIKESLSCHRIETVNPAYLRKYSNELIESYDCHLAYGILRGTADVFKECDTRGLPWFNVDRGYFHPNHYDGFYRISLRGTQQTTGLDKLEPDYERLAALKLDIKPWRGFDAVKPVLVIRPTEHVQQFFNTDAISSTWFGIQEWILASEGIDYCVRTKGDPTPINFNDYNYVLTFNSSVGWQALAAGIPCVSNPNHSIVGAWFNPTNCDKSQKQLEDISEMQYKERERFFAVLASLQLTLVEMRAGKLWPLMSKLMSTSGMTVENPQLVMSPLTQYFAAPNNL